MRNTISQNYRPLYIRVTKARRPKSIQRETERVQPPPARTCTKKIFKKIQHRLQNKKRKEKKTSQEREGEVKEDFGEARVSTPSWERKSYLCSNGDDRRHEERKDLDTKNEVQRKQKGTGKSTTKCGNTRASERVYNSAGDEDNDKQNKDDNKTELKQHRLDPVCLQLRCPGINGPDSPHQWSTRLDVHYTSPNDPSTVGMNSSSAVREAYRRLGRWKSNGIHSWLPW